MTDFETVRRVIQFPMERRQDRIPNDRLPVLWIAFGIACATAFIGWVMWAWICVLFSHA